MYAGSSSEFTQPYSLMFGTKKYARLISCDSKFVGCVYLTLNRYLPFVGIPIFGSWLKICSPNSLVVT